jgi:hypothetical protein
MSTTNLMSPFFEGGLKSIKFFNGRLLSGEDLTIEQIANRQANKRLARAIGDGVVTGLEVAVTPGSASPTVTVQPGLAINRDGDAVALSSAVDVALFKPTAAANGASAGAVASPFAQCSPTMPGVFLTSAGVYLLTIAPASGTQGRAPVNGLSDGADKCNAKYIVDGVQFRLVALQQFSPDDLRDLRLRNIVAARCFGFDVDPLVDPFGGAPQPQGIVATLRPVNLSDAEVPIAVLCWTPTGIAFTDMWSVRRRVSAPGSVNDSPLPLAGQNVARGEAILLQFQDHLQSLMTGTPENVAATGVFKYMPPLFLLPLHSPTVSGFVQPKFFEGITVRDPIDIEGARAQAMIRASLLYPPVDLASGEMFWLYRTRQNAQSTTARPFVFAVSGQMPYFGESRFNVARFDFAAWSP